MRADRLCGVPSKRVYKGSRRLSGVLRACVVFRAEGFIESEIEV